MTYTKDLLLLFIDSNTSKFEKKTGRIYSIKKYRKICVNLVRKTLEYA